MKKTHFKDKINFKKIGDITIPKLHGGRQTIVHKTRKKSTRKDKSWKQEIGI